MAKSLKHNLCLILAPAPILFGSAAYGQTAPLVAQQSDRAASESAFGIGDIVVTARKRAETAQNVPVSVTALDADMLQQKLITSIEDLGRTTPNVSFQPVSVNRTQFAPYIRGIGTRSAEPFQDPAVAISIDGVYLGTLIGSSVDIFDVKQIEVLRGPQGTLQGRNSPAGAVNITTRRPGDTFGARFEAGYGSFDTLTLKGEVESPIQDDKLAVKVAAYRVKSDGYVKNLTSGTHQSGTDSWGTRVGVLFRPTDTLTAYITADYLRDTGSQPGLRNVASSVQGLPGQPDVLVCSVLVALGGCLTDRKYTSRSEYVADNYTRSWSATANINWDITDRMSLTSVTGYRNGLDIQQTDVDATAIPLLTSIDQRLAAKQTSEELRLASSSSELNYVLGLYYANVEFDFNQPITALGSVIPSQRGQKLNAYAVFGQGTYNITDAWTVSGGFRQSWDRKRVSTAFYAPSPPEVLTAPSFYGTRANFSNLSIEGGTEYKLDRDILAYFRYAQGYRAGGLNANQTVAAAILPYSPERVDSYEVGLKSEWFGRRLLVNVAGFWTSYKNLQRDVVVTLPVAPFFAQIVQNQGRARIRGVEVEIVARPVKGLNLSTSVGYLDATFSDTGARLPFTSRWTIQNSASYDIDLVGAGTLTPAIDLSSRSRSNVNGALQPVGKVGAYSLLNTTLTYRSENKKFAVTAYAQNLTNKYYFTAAESPGGIGAWVADGAPRSYGIRFNVEY